MSTFPISRRRLGAWSAAMAAGVALPMVARAQPARVTVAVGGQGVLYHLPLTIAQQLGFFASEGLDVTVRDFPGGAPALQAVQAGAADVCSGAYEHTIRMQGLGQMYRAFVLQGRAPQLALGVSARALPHYRQWGDLRGRRVGVSAPGSSTHLVASMVLARAGLSERD
ncbi:MAG: ABC transporter substrate-binding protein, partial [Burkholderiaceae bacterium]